MFKTYEHFKKATKTVFDEFRKNRNLKLSDFRNIILNQTEHQNIQSYSSSFSNEEKISSSEITSILEIKNGIVTSKSDFPSEQKETAQFFFETLLTQHIFDKLVNEESLTTFSKGYFHTNDGRTVQIISSGQDNSSPSLQKELENKENFGHLNENQKSFLPLIRPKHEWDDSSVIFTKASTMEKFRVTMDEIRTMPREIVSSKDYGFKGKKTNPQNPEYPKYKEELSKNLLQIYAGLGIDMNSITANEDKKRFSYRLRNLYLIMNIEFYEELEDKIEVGHNMTILTDYKNNLTIVKDNNGNYFFATPIKRKTGDKAKNQDGQIVAYHFDPICFNF